MRDDECEDRRSGYIIIQTLHGQGFYYNTDNVCTGVEPNNYKLEVPSGNGSIYFVYTFFQKSILSKTNLNSHRVEQLRLVAQQRVVGTVEDSVLHTEMSNLEPQEEDVSRHVLLFRSMSWLGKISSHHKMRTGLLVADRHFLPLVSVLMYRS
jgi:hypothetical protein